MLKLREGPKMRKFAIAMETTVEDVLKWANGQINDPTEYYKTEYPTPEARRDAIQKYMSWVIDYDLAEGITERIKRSLEKECSTQTNARPAA